MILYILIGLPFLLSVVLLESVQNVFINGIACLELSVLYPHIPEYMLLNFSVNSFPVNLSFRGKSLYIVPFIE